MQPEMTVLEAMELRQGLVNEVKRLMLEFTDRTGLRISMEADADTNIVTEEDRCVIRVGVNLP